jgi:hypothetical protein
LRWWGWRIKMHGCCGRYWRMRQCTRQREGRGASYKQVRRKQDQRGESDRA